MTPHFLIWSFGPQIGSSVERICHQTDSMNRFYLDVKTGPNEEKLLYTVPTSKKKYGGTLRILVRTAKTPNRRGLRLDCTFYTIH